MGIEEESGGRGCLTRWLWCNWPGHGGRGAVACLQEAALVVAREPRSVGPLSESAAAAPLHLDAMKDLNIGLVKRRRPASLRVYIAAVFHSKKEREKRERETGEKTLNVLKNHRPAVLEAELRVFIIHSSDSHPTHRLIRFYVRVH